MKRLREEENRKPRRRLAKLVWIGLAIFLMVLSLEIWAVNRLSTYGDKIREIKTAQANLELENQFLENSIAQSSSLNSVEERANAWGFDSMKGLKYLSAPRLASAR